MTGRKTHEQQLRTLERKPDIRDTRQPIRPETGASEPKRGERRSEFPVSRRGMNQESPHNKHNDGGQAGHKPQNHKAAEQE